jgi:hypothetical protein
MNEEFAFPVSGFPFPAKSKTVQDYSKNKGNPFTVNSSSLGVGSSFPISISAGGAMFLTVNPLSPSDA